ncbi:MAG: glycosyltransferase family 39 protein [Myxococcales bacterium]|nr:glycosyltransferase family 39 protein [Myxococcales bacterium]
MDRRDAAETAQRGIWPKIWDTTSVLVLVGVLAVALTTFGAYGITWDEWGHQDYGDRILRFFTSRGRDQSATHYKAIYFYGGGYDLLGALFRRLAAPLPGHEAMHLLGALVGVLGLAGIWRLGRGLGGPFVGLAALVLLAFNPVYYGHMFNNPKDMPFAVAYVWSLHVLARLLGALPRPPRRLWIALAICVGLAMSVRVAGLLLLCYLALLLGIHALQGARARRSVDVGLALLERHALRVVACGVVAWTIMIAAWPWALRDPARPLAALSRMSAYTAHHRVMPFAGERISNLEIGWRYLPHYLGLQLPELVLVLALAGSLGGALVLVRRRRDPRALPLALLGLAAWFPPLYAIARGSVFYDGYRHVLFVVMPLTVIAALALARVGEALHRRVGPASGPILSGVLALHAIDLGRTMAMLHPHEYVYFNRLAGGLHGAYRRYDTDYYGNTFKESMGALADHLWRSEPERYLDTIYRWRGCISNRTGDRYLPANFVVSQAPDFYVGYTRSECDRRHGSAPIIVRVRRDGVDLNVVRDLRRKAAADRATPPTAEDGVDDRPRPPAPRWARRGEPEGSSSSSSGSSRGDDRYDGDADDDGDQP